jgi:ribosomal protein L23
MKIADILEQLYKVKVGDIRIMNRKGKTRRAGRKMQTRVLPDIKLAYITLKEGTIDIFPKA